MQYLRDSPLNIFFSKTRIKTYMILDHKTSHKDLYMNKKMNK